MKEYDGGFSGGGSPPLKRKKPKKFFGLSRGVFAAIVSESALIIILTAAVIALLAGRGGGSPSESGKPQSEDVQSEDTARTAKAPRLVGRLWGDALAEEYGWIDFIVVRDPDSDAPQHSITAQNPSEGTTLYKDKGGRCKLEITVSGNDFSDEYRSLVGKTLDDAMSWLEKCGVKKSDVFRKYSVSVSGVGDGCVSSFAYEDGREVKEGEKIKAGGRFVITVNSYAHSVTVPLLGGKSFEEAAEALYGAGLNVGKISRRESGMADGTVLSQSPAEYEAAYCGDSVDLVLSKRGTAFPMPSLLGMTLDEAKSCLAEHSLELGTVSEDSNREYDAGAVCTQSVPEGADVYAASVIDLSLTLGGKADGRIEDWDAENLVIDISENAHLSAGTVEKLAARGEGKTAYAKCDFYVWTLPAGISYPQGDGGLDLSVSVNGGEAYSNAAAILIGKGFDAADFSVFVCDGAQSLPDGLTLSVNLGASFGGESVKLLALDERTGDFVSFSDEPSTVENDGFLSLKPKGASVYAAVKNSAEYYVVDVLYDESKALCREGSSISVEAGSKLTLHIEAKDGFLLKSVEVGSVKLEGVDGKSSFVYTLPYVDRGMLVVITAQSRPHK